LDGKIPKLYGSVFANSILTKMIFIKDPFERSNSSQIFDYLKQGKSVFNIFCFESSIYSFIRHLRQ